MDILGQTPNLFDVTAIKTSTTLQDIFMWIIMSGDQNYGGTKIWVFFSEIQYEISEI